VVFGTAFNGTRGNGLGAGGVTSMTLQKVSETGTDAYYSESGGNTPNVGTNRIRLRMIAWPTATWLIKALRVSLPHQLFTFSPLAFGPVFKQSYYRTTTPLPATTVDYNFRDIFLGVNKPTWQATPTVYAAKTPPWFLKPQSFDPLYYQTGTPSLDGGCFATFEEHVEGPVAKTTYRFV
jgi:hypothetical protein